MTLPVEIPKRFLSLKMVRFAVCFDMNRYYIYSIHIWITDYLMEALKDFETNQIFRLVKTKKSTTISHGVYFFFHVKTNNVIVKSGSTAIVHGLYTYCYLPQKWRQIV